MARGTPAADKVYEIEILLLERRKYTIEASDQFEAEDRAMEHAHLGDQIILSSEKLSCNPKVEDVNLVVIHEIKKSEEEA